MDRENLDYWCEKGILGLFLATVVFATLATGAVYPLQFLVIQVLTAVMAILWVARLWLREKDRLLWTPICWCVLAFSICAILRYQWADLEYPARSELLRIVVYALLFLIVLDNLHRQESTQAIAFVLIFLGMAVSLYAVFQFVTQSHYVWHMEKYPQYWSRGSGTFFCPNHLAGYLEMILPLGLAYTIMGRLKPVTKVFLSYASAVMVAGIVVSMSRGGWIAAALALLAFFGVLMCYRESRIPAIAFFALLMAGGLYFLKDGFRVQERWKQLVRGFDEGNEVRFFLWEPALEMWRGHFWTGVGPAHFDYRFPAYRPEVVQARPGWAHNDYLNTLADWGLSGALIIALALVLLVWGILRSWKYVRRTSDLASKPSNRAACVLGGSIGIAAILLHSFVDFNMQVPANAIVAITLMALVSTFQRFATERFWVPLSPLVRVVFTAGCLVAVGFLAQHALKRAPEALALRRADQMARSVAQKSAALERMADEALKTGKLDLKRYEELVLAAEEDAKQEIEFLRKAHAAEPRNFETTYRIGEALRLRSWQGRDQYQDLAEEALVWFGRGIRLNPYDPYNYLRYGMCLDWLKRYTDSELYYTQARERDPNNFYVIAHVGWHYFVVGDYTQAKKWFNESLRLSDWRSNHIARSHLTLIANRELEKRAHPGLPGATQKD